MRVGIIVAMVCGLLAPASARADVTWTGFPRVADSGVFAGPVAPAACGSGDAPETGVQGQVPKADRDSGRSLKPYSCNLRLVGAYQGQGASWVSQSYGHCAYMSTRSANTSGSPGVQVLDVSDPAHPRLTTTLTSPGMLGTWETLKVDPSRGLLAGALASGPVGQGAGFMDIYDLKPDCAHPKQLTSLTSSLANTFGHEGQWSPDGRTYWTTSAYTGLITAIDTADPTRPRILFFGRTGVGNHGLGISADGRRMYLAEGGNLGTVLGLSDSTLEPNGMQVFDVSDIQDRRPDPQIRQLGEVEWTDGGAGQHDIPVFYGEHPYVIHVDEFGSGAVRVIDIADEAHPQVISKLRLQIQMPDMAAVRKADTGPLSVFGYDAHYCTADRAQDPTALACGEFESGVRVFDIRDPRHPSEIAYYNPGGHTGQDLGSSEHPVGDANDLTTDWCTSPPRFVDGGLWVTCQDSGFLALQFTNGVYPRPTGQDAALGLPSTRRCASRRVFTLHLPRGLSAIRVTVNGRRVRATRRSARIDLRGLPKGTARVRITARKRGRTVSSERVYRTCAARRTR